MYSNQVYIMLQLLSYSKTIHRHIDIRYKCFNDKLFVHEKKEIQLLIYTNV